MRKEQREARSFSGFCSCFTGNTVRYWQNLLNFTGKQYYIKGRGNKNEK